MKEKPNLWTTMPGVLTGVAALITAIGGILVASGVITTPASKSAVTLPSGPRVFRTVSGVGFWEKMPDGSWLEHSIQQPNFTMKFREYTRNDEYIILVDSSRVKDNNPDNPFILRLPIKGGTVEWSYSNPEQWTPLTEVKPE